MTAAVATAIVLLLATVLALWRLRRWPAGGRRGGLLALQPLLGLALYFALFPPPRAGEGGTLVVAAAGSTPASVAAAAGERTVALPEAPATLAVERVPDLATALRRHPGMRQVRLVGDGLGPRDRDAATTVALAWDPPAATPGLAWLSTPPLLATGAGFQVAGQVVGVAGARLELLDPAGQRIAQARTDGAGRFVLAGSVRQAGLVDFRMRVLDAGGRLRDHATLPVVAADAPSLQLQWLAGAPQPELKYLRRWADDAGVASRSRIAVGGGLQLGDPAPGFDPSSLDTLDLLVVDERSLAGLGGRQRAALAAAVARGLGVLVRLGDVPDAGQRAALAQLGWTLHGDGHEQDVALDPTQPDSAGGVAGGPAAAPSNLHRLALTPASPDIATLAQDRDGQPFAWWQAHGRGRIGITTLLDSYRLVLEGDAGRHGALWSALLSPLARPRPPALQLQAPAWLGERALLCRLPADARLHDGDGHPLALLPDGSGCSAIWPRRAGGYRWQAGERQGLLPVRAPAAAPGLHANAGRQATLELRSSAAPRTATAMPGIAGPHWPGWLAFVLLAALAWWLERRRPPGQAQPLGKAS